ncbi:MAG: nucleoside-diphosphate sugar epimerase/dehydratase [Pseudomonadota bacterium]
MVHTTVRQFVDELTRRQRRAFQIAFDTVALIGCAAFAILITGKSDLGSVYPSLITIGVTPLVGIPIFVRLGLYRTALRYIPNAFLLTVGKASALLTLTWTLLSLILSDKLALSTFVQSASVFGMFAFCVTFLSRHAAQTFIYGIPDLARKRIAIYGAGSAGLTYLEALSNSPDVEVAALFDDDQKLFGREFKGIRVYNPRQLELLVNNLGIKDVVVCMPSVSGQRRLELAARLSKAQARVKVLPSLTEVMAGKFDVVPSAEINFDELLGRSPVPPDMALIRSKVEGATIIVTGAGGSIGSELVKTLALNSAARIIMIDHSEFALFEAHRNLEQYGTDTNLVPILASVTDNQALMKAFETYGPSIVYHAAAYKHVGLGEQNPTAAFYNNVIGTRLVLAASQAFKVRDCVLISTDKAVRPTSIMGATKRLAELLVRHYADQATDGERFSSVRFGNVIGSKGSVVPLFAEQIRRGGPIVVRGENTQRYFMSITEACELIVQASALAEGGETFLLKMGEPLSIKQLAKNMIELSGLSVRDHSNPNGDIEIDVRPIQPGEKHTEEFAYDRNVLQDTRHPMIVKGKLSTSLDRSIIEVVFDLTNKLNESGNAAARDAIMDCVRSLDSQLYGR